MSVSRYDKATNGSYCPNSVNSEQFIFLEIAEQGELRTGANTLRWSLDSGTEIPVPICPGSST